MKKNSYRNLILGCLGALALTACSDKEAETSSPQNGESLPVDTKMSINTDTRVPNYVPANPYLSNTVVPIAHVNSAQSTGMAHSGTRGPTEILSEENGGLTYTHLGPGHYGFAISEPYPNGKRVIWSNGGERISKLDYDTLAVIDEYFIENSSSYKKNGGPVTVEQADKEFAMLDALPKEPGTGMEILQAALPITNHYYGAGMAGVYYLLSSENVLYVGGKNSILAYADEDPSDPNSTILLKGEWKKPPEVEGSFISINMTYDGWLVSLSDDGWLVITNRDFSQSHMLQLTGAEVGPAWNQAMLDRGYSAGAAPWVRNGAAIDKDGGIYIPTLQHMHKIIWDGKTLSKDPANGAWVEPYSNKGDISVTLEGVIDPSTGEPYRFENVNTGSGSTASLMGFGDEDQFVVISDGDKVMNMVLFWRNDIPEDWQQLENAPSRRIAGMLRADIGQSDAEDVQSDQSVVIGGYGALVVNNAPASHPMPQIQAGFYVGIPGAHPDFTPHGVQKFEWEPVARELRVSWVNTEVSSANCVPLAANGSDMVYTVGGRDGAWILQGIDWTSGESVFQFEVGSSRYNTQYSGILMGQEGRLMHTTMQGVVRYERFPE
jgi:hypothetical protein